MYLWSLLLLSLNSSFQWSYTDMPTLLDYPGVSRIRHWSPALLHGSPNLPYKMDFWAFLCFSLKFNPFFSQNLNFFIHNMVSGTFLHIFSLWQGSVCGWGVVGLLTFRGRGEVQNRETPGWRSLAVDISACTVMEWALTCLFDLFSGLIWPL